MTLKQFEPIFKNDIAPLYIQHQKDFDEFGIHGCLHISRSLIISRLLFKQLTNLGFLLDIDKIAYYQSRKLPGDSSDLPNYLSKSGGERSLFNINKVNEQPYVFIFEGPLDVFHKIHLSPPVAVFNNRSYGRDSKIEFC